MDARSMLPESRLGRVRVVLLAFSLLVLLLSLAQLDPASDVVGISIVADLLLVSVLVGTAIRGAHVTIWEAPATAALTVLVGLGLDDPRVVGVTAIGVVLSQTLYGRGVNDALRALSFLPVYSLTGEFSQIGDGAQVHWYSHSVLAGAPIVPLMVGVIASLRGSLLAQEQTLIRAHFLASLTSELLGAPDQRAVTAVMKRATDAVCEVIPGLTVLALRRIPPGEPDAGGARVTGVHGPGAEAVPKLVPADVLAPLDTYRLELFDELKHGSKSMAANGFPKHRTWRVETIQAPPEIIEVIDADTMLWGVPQCFSERFFGIPGPQGTETLELLEAYNRHGMQATQNATTRWELLNRVSHDAPTGAVNRDAFLARMESLFRAGTQCALVLSEVEVMRDFLLTHGLQPFAGMIEQHGERVMAVAERFAAEVPGIFVARITDTVFCVVLPGHPELADQVREQVSERLAEPFTVAGTAMPLHWSCVTAGPQGEGSLLGLIEAGVTSVMQAEARRGTAAGPQSLRRP